MHVLPIVIETELTIAAVPGDRFRRLTANGRRHWGEGGAREAQSGRASVSVRGQAGHRDIAPLKTPSDIRWSAHSAVPSPQTEANWQLPPATLHPPLCDNIVMLLFRRIPKSDRRWLPDTALTVHLLHSIPRTRIHAPSLD
jgi:hypothetical protein